jgi:hypothetical protein
MNTREQKIGEGCEGGGSPSIFWGFGRSEQIEAHEKYD